MKSAFCKMTLLLGLILCFRAQVEQSEQTGMMNSKIKEYQEVMNLDTATIQSNCADVKMYYDRSIEAYDFLSTFTIETMEETLQNIGKLRDLGNDLEQQASATFEQLALRGQLEETRTKMRLEELQWRVNWSSNAQSNEVPSEEIKEMKEEITSISGDKQKELDDLIYQKTSEQTQLTEQIQLGESSYNKLNADKEDIKAAITVLNDKLNSNAQELKETMEANQTRGDKLQTLYLQLQFFENEKKTAISFDSIKQLAQLSIKTQEEMNQISNDIEIANNKIVELQESNNQVNDNLSTKQAEMQEINLQMENVNTQLVQIKQQSDEVTNLIEKTKNEQQLLFSQLMQKTSFIQMRQELTEDEKKLKRAEDKVQEGKFRVERLEREQQMYQDNYMRAQQKINEINQKLLLTNDLAEKEQLEEELQRQQSQYQKAWDNYVEKKEELVKEKQLLVTFENFETSIQNDELKKQQDSLEQEKQDQEKREEEIEKKTEELDNKLKLKEQEKGEACAIKVQTEVEQNETVIEEEDGPIIIPTPKPQQVMPQGEQPPIIPDVIQPEQLEKLLPEEQPIADIPQPEIPTPDIIVKQEEPKIEIPQPQPPTLEPQPIDELPNPSYPIERPEIKKPIQEIIRSTISPEGEKELEKAEESQKKGKIVNEVKELLKKYEELIVIKEQHVEEQLKIVVEKEEIVIKKETEIHEASEKIKVEVQKCKEQKREIIHEAKEERETIRSKFSEQQAKQEIDRLNIKLKEEFLKEGEIFKKKKETEEKEEKIREKQATLDKKVEEIEKKIFKDIPTPKKSDTIKIDVGGMHASAPKTSYTRVAGSTIPLAYPWEGHNYVYKDEVIVPKPEAEIKKLEFNIKQQEKKAEVQKEVVEEQKEEIKKEQKQVQLKEYEIQQKEQHFQEKKVEVQQEINKLDEDIARCKLIFGQGDEQSQEYQMCQWQSDDYEQKKKQLEEMKNDYEKELNDFNKAKEQFYSSSASFVELQANAIDKKLQNHINCLAQLSKRNKRCLAKSLRHNDGMIYLLQSTNKLSDHLKSLFLSMEDNSDQVKVTLKQVLDEINKLYETAIVQRNLKQGQNKLLEQKKKLMKLQSACLEAQRILQQ